MDIDIEPVFTDFMTTYADMDAAITKKDQVDRSFTTANLDETRRTVKDFANTALVYEVRSFQASDFNFLKFHKMGSHCVNDIEDLGGLIYHCSSHLKRHTPRKGRGERHVSQDCDWGVGNRFDVNKEICIQAPSQ